MRKLAGPCIILSQKSYMACSGHQINPTHYLGGGFRIKVFSGFIIGLGD